MHIVEGGDQALRVPAGTHFEKESTAALDAALGSFFAQALGARDEWSREEWVAPAPEPKKAKTKEALAAAVASVVGV